MRLLLSSDVHSEFYDDPVALTRQIVPSTFTPDNLDFLVLAGDIVVPSRQTAETVKGVFDYLSQRARHVLYITGNHEFYGGSLEAVEEKLQAVLPTNFHWLENSEVTIEGKHFFGGTMWFNNADGMNGFFRREMNDFYQIRDFENWVYKRNSDFTQNGVMIRPETIVISHHLPHPKSTPVQFKNSSINRFFVSDQTQLIMEMQPRYWLHGHTHHSCDYTLDQTRVLCNPYGYPTERNDRYPQVLIEI